MKLGSFSKNIRKLFILVIIPLLVYVLLEVYPQPFFRQHISKANIHIYSDVPFPPEITAIMETVKQRVEKSELYNAQQQYRVFLCSSRILFGFFANYHYRVGGVNQILFGNNIFIRPANIHE